MTTTLVAATILASVMGGPGTHAESGATLGARPAVEVHALPTDEVVRWDGVPEQEVLDPHAGVDAMARELMESQRLVGVAVAIVQDGAVRYLKGFGWADREAEVPVLAHRTMFRWASIAKTTTAVMAARLVREGVVALDPPVQAWLPEFEPPTTYLEPCNRPWVRMDGRRYRCKKGYADVPVTTSDISLGALLSHLSGVRGYTGGRTRVKPSWKLIRDPVVNTGMGWALAPLLKVPLLASPGDEYRYSTYGFNLAGVVLEKATGASYSDLLAEFVAGPAGLKTLQPDFEWVEIAERAAGYRVKRRKVTRQRSHDVSWKAAGGGLISTPLDLARYCGALMDDTLLTPAEKDVLWEEQLTTDGDRTGYGLGFAVGERDGRRFVEHAGVQPKARTRMRLFPDDDLCVVVMSNTTSCKTGVWVERLEDVARAGL
jgi:serine beta-lactamase-like protein LACTB